VRTSLVDEEGAEFIASRPLKGSEAELKAFSDVGLASLTGIDRGSVFLNAVPEEADGYDDQDEADVATVTLSHCRPKAVPVEPTGVVRDVASVDVSSMKIAEDARGIVIAVRGSLVRRKGDCVSADVLGPFLFYVTEQNKDFIYASLRSRFLGEERPVESPQLESMPKRICNLFDRWIQMSAATSLRDSILLLDGSLTAGTVDSPTRVMEHLVLASTTNGNSIIAFSKMTRLRVLGVKITELENGHAAPYLLKIGHLISQSARFRCLGQIYVAHLSPVFYSYRVDVNSGSAKSDAEAIGSLLSSDAFTYGYPETLVYAHILSTFNKLDVIGLQRFLTEQMEITITEDPCIRQSLFLPFDRS